MRNYAWKNLWLGMASCSSFEYQHCIVLKGTIFGLQALPSDEAVQWREKEELQDLYSVYVGRDKDTAKQSVVQKLFALSDKDAKSLKEVVDAGQFKLEAEDDDSSFF